MSAARSKGTRFESAVVKWLREALQDDRIERRSLNGRNDRGDVAGCSLPHIAPWVLTLPVRLIGWAVSLRPTRGRA